MAKLFLIITFFAIILTVTLAAEEAAGDANPITDGDTGKEAKPKRGFFGGGYPDVYGGVYPGLGYGGGYQQQYQQGGYRGYSPYYGNSLGYGGRGYSGLGYPGYGGIYPGINGIGGYRGYQGAGAYLG